MGRMTGADRFSLKYATVSQEPLVARFDGRAMRHGWLCHTAKVVYLKVTA